MTKRDLYMNKKIFIRDKRAKYDIFIFLTKRDLYMNKKTFIRDKKLNMMNMTKESSTQDVHTSKKRPIHKMIWQKKPMYDQKDLRI